MVEDVKLVLEKVKRIPGLAKRLPDSAHLIDDVGLDSLEMMEFMLELEGRLQLAIDFDRIDFSYLESIEKFSGILATMKSDG